MIKIVFGFALGFVAEFFVFGKSVNWMINKAGKDPKRYPIWILCDEGEYKRIVLLRADGKKYGLAWVDNRVDC